MHTCGQKQQLHAVTLACIQWQQLQAIAAASTFPRKSTHVHQRQAAARVSEISMLQHSCASTSPAHGCARTRGLRPRLPHQHPYSACAHLLVFNRGGRAAPVSAGSGCCASRHLHLAAVSSLLPTCASPTPAPAATLAGLANVRLRLGRISGFTAITYGSSPMPGPVPAAALCAVRLRPRPARPSVASRHGHIRLP
jgi:hypothetical protein